MQLGMIGLGRMGATMVKRLATHGRDSEQNKQDQAGDSRPGNLNGCRHMGGADPFASISYAHRKNCQV
jgi:6-phosphogluconate dehydrogenase (decarboxylating)